MRIDNVNQSKKIGYIKFNTDAEIDLIGESLDRLIAKQEKIAQKVGNNKDDQEMEKLERFKQSKERVIEMPKQHKIRLREMREKVKDKVKKNDKEGKNTTEEPDIIIDIEDNEEFKSMAKNIANSEIDAGLREGTEVIHRDIHTIVNALNQHIWEMEKDGLYKKTRRNKNKYEKLQHLLLEAQQQKTQFERVTPKPKGWGRLRR
jgi:hypothetical protein